MMRIDLTASSMPELERSQGTTSSESSAQAGVGATSAQDDDVAQLSTSSDVVASLRAQLNSVPDVRQSRVEYLRQAIDAGQFSISPERIADGMLAGSVAGAQS